MVRRARGGRSHARQLQLLELAGEGRDTLLIAPTGKTLASFLPSLVDLIACGAKSHAGIQTLYVSPLKALAVDIANLADPVTEMGLPIKLKNPAPATPGCRAASGSGSVHPISYSPRRSRSRLCCSIAMLRASHGHHRRAARDGLDQAGDLLALDLARLRTLSPDLKRSASRRRWHVRPSSLRFWLATKARPARSLLRSSMREPGQRRITPSSTLTRSFTEPGTPHLCAASSSSRRATPAASTFSTNAFSSLFHWHSTEAWLTGRTGVYPLQANLLLPD